MQHSTQEMQYELVDISWSLDYDFNKEPVCYVVADDTLMPGQEPKERTPEIVCDADGIPMGQSMEEIRQREKIIDEFFTTWYERHKQDTNVYNVHLKENISVKHISIEEAKHHACKSYRSTIAVIKHLETILANALPIKRMPTKEGNKNQSQFEYMLLMKHEIEDLGTIKLTVGVRIPKDRPETIRVEYGISALRPDQPLIEEQDMPRVKKKRKAHR